MLDLYMDECLFKTFKSEHRFKFQISFNYADI